MKKTVIGIIAHVDSGKTTLSEAMLYLSGKIRKVGRVDHGDAFLDTDMIEKYRGITVFSKPAEFEYKNTSFTLLDTPGHVDFSAETERALQVLDLAVLVISGTDGVQSHTQTLWRLLKRYNVPTFVFVNKMDLDGADKNFVMNSLEGRLGSGFVDFCRMKSEVAEDCALFDENIMNEFLETGSMSDKILSDSVAHRKVFPCFFGSALKSQGIEKFMNALAELAPCVYDSGTFGAKVYKISEDGGSRLTFMKITGGCLKVRDLVDYTSADGETFSEKVSRIRIYSGAKGKLICTSDGYRECHNTEVVLEEYGYNPDRDLENTADSVFCSHGAGYNVKWNEVPDKLHIPPEDKRRQVPQSQSYARAEDFVRRAASDKELMEIFERTYGKIDRDKHYAMRRPEKSVKSASKPKQIYSGVEYLLVDGYNIIFSWDELKKAANESLDLARSMLVNRLCNYQGYKQCELILVFDAYKVKEQERVVENYHNISIVYTKEAETADTYIERTAHKLSREHKVRVATSDGMEQVIIMGSGAFRMSAQELHEDVIRVEKEIREYISNMK